MIKPNRIYKKSVFTTQLKAMISVHLRSCIDQGQAISVKDIRLVADEALGEIIKEMREARGLSQTDVLIAAFPDRDRVNRQYLSMIEQADASTSTKQFNHIIDTLRRFPVK